jgi:hypothetical protein
LRRRPEEGAAFCCREARPEWKECVVDLDHKPTEDLAKMAVWSQGSLEYAREHGQRKLIWLLEAVRIEAKLEDALLALPLGEHLGSKRGISSGKWKAMRKKPPNKVPGSPADVPRRVSDKRLPRERARPRSLARPIGGAGVRLRG